MTPEELEQNLREIEKILIAESDSGRRKLARDATVSQMMGADISQYDRDSQFRITNERMLAVRDDLTQFINANFGRLAQETVKQITGALNRLMQLHLEHEARLELMRGDVIGLTGAVTLMHAELQVLRAELSRRWYRELWKWIGYQVVALRSFLRRDT